MTTPFSDRTERCLDAIERRNRSLNALITVTPDQARATAAELDAQIAAGDRLGAAAGLVISIKDNIDTAGLRTTSGSAFFADRVPDEDAEVVRRVAQAGTVLIGKANLHEFAFGGTSQNPHHGPCRNPWDAEAIPGGSSGGSAASVAAGMCEASLGTDTGGSVRIPAALNGVVGLRPTVGRIPNRGSTPVSPRFDTIGPLGRTVAEVAAIYEAIAGYDPLDETSVDTPVESWTTLTRGLGGLRIGLPTSFFFDGLHAEVDQLVRAAARTLEGLGAKIIPVHTQEAAETHARMISVVLSDVAAFHRERLETRPETFGADVHERMMLGFRTSGMDYAQGMRQQERWGRQVRGIFEEVDMVLTPTVGFPAPKAVETKEMIATTRELTRLTFVWSYAELPALSVPCGFTRAGLPVGMQLVGRKWSEARLLAIGAAYQQVTDYHHRRPPGVDQR